MKNFHYLLPLLFLYIASPVIAGTDDFRMAYDGSVKISGHRFANIESYLRSVFFRENGKRCGTKTPPPGLEDRAMAKNVTDCTTTLTRIQSEYWPTSLTYIMPIWFHVIYKTDGTGNISDARINDQIQILNEDYAALVGSMGSQGFNTRIQFELAGITRTVNNNWFDNDEENNYKPALKKDTSQYINIYTTTAHGYLGYAYFPQDSAGSWFDGIVLYHSSVGGRDNGFSGYDQGRTLVHEMGHYLGLYHTFQGGTACNNTYSGGDLIVDTPAESVDHYDCTQTYTCGSADPIHNYMDYTDDVCMYQFSSEQANRAVCSLVNYRPETYREAGGSSTEMVIPAIMLILDNE